MLVQPLLPSFSILSEKVFALEPEPAVVEQTTPTPEPTAETTPETIAPTPTEEVTPSPTVEVTPTPVEQVSPTPTVEVTPTPSTEQTQPNSGENISQQTNGPPSPAEASAQEDAEQGQILDGVSTALPAEASAKEGTPTPTIAVEEPTEAGNLQAVILQNVEADSLNLDNVDPNTSASLTTDKADYAPTDTALITGTGFLANHTYKLTVSSDDTPATSTTVEITTDDTGSFVYAYQLDGIYRPNYKVEVKDGEVIVASTSFTDAQVQQEGSYNLDQGKNGGNVGVNPISPVEWVNGNLNENQAHYQEGQSVAYRVILSDLPTGVDNTVKIEWDIRQSSQNAIDYITGPQRIAETVDPTTGVAGFGAASYWPIPAPTTNATRITSFNALPNDNNNKNLWAYNVSDVSFGYYVNGSDAEANTSSSINITFTPTSPTVVLAWGGHIASETDWGIGNGATGVPGSPYHSRILELCNGTPSVCGGGNQDRSLSAGAVVTQPQGSITIVKVGNGVNSQDFGFDTTGGLFANETSSPEFSLDDDGDNTNILSNTRTFSTLSAGTYSVTEVATDGWTLASATCSDGSPVSAISLQEGETTTCTFTNTFNTGSIKVNKMVDANGDGDYLDSGEGVNGTASAPFTWTYRGIGPNIMGATQTSLTSGTGSLSENTVTNYHLVGWFEVTPSTTYSCTNLPVATANHTLPASIDILTNQTVEITICNALDTAKIRVTKNLITANDPGRFNLLIDGVEYATNVGDLGTTGFITVPLGVHTVSETAVTPTSLGNYNVSFTPPCGLSGQVAVTAGQEITCLINNGRKESLVTVNKQVDTDGNGSWVKNPATFTWTLNGGSSNAMGNTVTFPFTQGATVSITENTVPGYHFIGWFDTFNTGGFSCSNLQHPTTTLPITYTDDGPLGSNRNITLCNVVDAGSISGYKYDTTSGLGLLGWIISLLNNTSSATTSTSTAADGSYSFANLFPSTYTLSESFPILGSWTQTEAPTNPITLSAGQVVTGQNFRNFQNVSISGQKFNDLDGDGTEDAGEPGLANWTIYIDTNNNGSLDSGETSTTTDANGDYSLTNVGPGTYKVREVVQTGWTQTSANPSDITTASGQNVIGIDFGNFNLGQISGKKYSDLNGNGEDNEGEPGLSGWTVYIDTNDNGSLDSGETSTTTGANGSYTLSNLGPGTYTIREVGQTGWTQTDPTAIDTGVGGQANGSYVVTMTSNGNKTQRNFGNRGNLSITACKYEDSNGTQNGGNFTPVSNWNFTLGQTIQNTVDDNCTTFENLTPGTYDVSELPVRDGWYVADDSQGSRRVVLTDENQLVNFYNYQKGEISGTKWNDVNSNGEWEYWNDEPTLSDWHIQLFENDDGVKGAQVGADQITTSDGDFSFADINPGDYLVCEVLQDGWTQTYPDFDQNSPNCHEVTVTSGQEYGGNDFGNFKLGQIYGYKYEDTDGDGYWDEGESGIEDWQICLNGDEDCTYTDEDGYFEFTGLEYGYYELTEDETNPDYQRTQPETNSTEILIESGTGFGDGDAYYFGNAPLTDIGGYKWSDENGNGRRDCTFNDDTDESTECENILGGWTIFLDENGNEQLDEDENSTTTEDSTQSDNFGRYSFFDLLPGDYSICEVRQDGWNQTYPLGEETYCHNITVPNDDEEYNFGNQLQNPIVTITKVNDATGDKAPGDSVLFTLTVTATQSAAYNVNVTDLPANGFSYILGSWTANSTTRGDLKASAITTEPTYASPGVWQLGDMAIDETVTLTYSAKISNDQKAGTYKDLAWAVGCRTDAACAVGDSNAVLATAINPGFIDEQYVGTTITINKDTQNSGSLSAKIGDVLGASTELPATGADNVWLLFIGLLFIAGLALILQGRSQKKGTSMFHKFTHMTMLTITALVLATTFAGQVSAASLNIRVSQPKSPTNQSSFPVSYVALDYNDNPVAIECSKKSPTDGSFVPFGPIQNLGNGGNSGTCEVTSAIMTDNGTYEFKVTASNGVDVPVFATTSVAYNTSGPGDVKDYQKNKTNTCEYTVHFKTANDAGKTVKVEVYRSENTSFTADAGSRIATINIGSDTAHDFTNTPPDCSKTYYYATRAFDSAGNGSAVVGDSITVTTTTTSSTSGASGTAGAIASGNQGGNILGQTTQSDGATGTTGTGETLGETSPSADVVPPQTPAKQRNQNRVLTWVGAILLLGALLYVAFKKKSTTA